MISIILATEEYGLDRHIWDVRFEKFETTILLGWICQFTFVLGTCCTKVSVLLFYRRFTRHSVSKPWKVNTAHLPPTTPPNINIS